MSARCALDDRRDERTLRIRIALAIVAELGGKTQFQRSVTSGELFVHTQGIAKHEVPPPEGTVEDHGVDMKVRGRTSGFAK
jgi:hypothetical protein